MPDLLIQGCPGPNQEHVASRRKPRSEGDASIAFTLSPPCKKNSAPSAAASAFHLTPVVLVGGSALRLGSSNNNTELTRWNGYVVEGRGAANEQTPPSASSSPQNR